jgi:hypothetical protein
VTRTLRLLYKESRRVQPAASIHHSSGCR